jgi:putative PIN family toxin of toxin-antitoxin system
MTRAIVDTNIVVSAFLWGGTPREILDAARRNTLTLFTSAALIAELEDVLSRPKFAKRIADVGSYVDEMLGDYLALAQLVRPPAHPPAVVRDPDDDHVIACALEAEAEVIVSNDDDLLTLGRYRNIAILSVAQMLRRLSTT